MTSERRLYVFDIDSTLIRTGGAGSHAMRAAFAALWGDRVAFDGVEFYGRTDLSLFKEALIRNGAPHSGFKDALARFKRAYYRRLPHSLRAKEGEVLPGVERLLARLSQDPDATVALGTGNFRFSAGLKLGHYGIGHYFRLGGFGDRSENRADVIAAGIRSATRKAGRHGTVYVIGDTELDIKAAHANSAVAVGVATGITDAGELSRAGADVVLTSLEHADPILP